ncbi:carboxy terminal-processing peptidase [Niabella pedocola]|uniref:Carboxy terminal-processing peptidase n=1 Tax=Niabella pedocola TaxID=1752077 RepID=A0ABS8PKX6_9BACT|nr:carboxy terminal-processing peptidase [Niabella pedocola]MCD2421651.1 carboxy terminal-processing peptidase [Niabella pedocola]
MKRLPFILLIILLTGSFFAFKSSMARTPPGKYEQIMGLVGQLLVQGHFSPQNIDDNFSKKVFDKFMDDLDFEKNVFLKSDYDSLAALYATRIDDEIKGAPVQSFLAVSSVFDRRIQETAEWSQNILAKPFDYTVNESITLNADKLQYPTSTAERQDRWRKKLKYLALERYVDLLDERTANKNQKGYVVKNDTELEKQARSRTDTVIGRLFERYKAKYRDEDKFDMFMNDIANTMDPHTSFMAPVDKRYFDEEMSGVFFGIGAALQQVDGKIKITSLNAGSPAEKSGQLQSGDIITKVAQGNGPAEDLMGYNVQDAVKLIRGKEGTIVKLTVRKTDGVVKVVSLKREKIENDFDTYARSAVINDPVKHTNVGIIYLPEFYAAFDDPNGRRSYLDVAKEVQKLKDAKVDGIIIDLRYNGGGSLYDVVQMVGLFVGKGPVVQVKGRINKPDVLDVKDESVLYDGPLAVMVNEFSASASEIFAAAIQDYGRGVIIGGTSTFGKGTVQRNFGLDAKNGITYGESDLGNVKLTLQKFYRVSGGSTQLKGVESDIVLPSYMDVLKLKEKDNKDALPYDEIAKADYMPWKSAWNLPEIKALSEQRLKADSSFKVIKENSQWLVRENDESSLNIESYRQERKAIKEKSDQMNAAQKLKNKMDVTLIPAEANKFAKDKNKEERAKQWLKILSEDIYLNQAANVVDDMVNIDRLAKNTAPPAHP